MALQRLRTVALVFVLLCSSQTFQLPIETAEEEALVQPHDATEQARVIWNSVKKLQRRVSPPRRREKRQAELEGTVTISETELETLAGVAPQYILDIYRNLSTTNMHTQANTIRSLKTLQTSKGEQPHLPRRLLTNCSCLLRRAIQKWRTSAFATR